MTDHPPQPPSTGIVVGYDGSPGSMAAVDWGAALAQRWDTPLTVLHSSDSASTPVDPEEDRDRGSERLAEPEQRVLDAGVARSRMVVTEPSQVVAMSAVGNPAGALVDASKHATLVVTGSSALPRVAAGLLGVVPYAVSAHAACPTVVVRAGHGTLPDRAHRVVVGVDESPASERALELAAEMAATSAATLHIVHVAHAAFSPEADAYVETAKGGSDHTRAVRARAQDTVRGAAQHAQATYGHLPVEVEVLYGHPGSVLAELGTHAGLLVVGSRGLGGFTGLLLGSVSHTVIHQAPCPVMVARI